MPHQISFPNVVSRCLLTYLFLLLFLNPTMVISQVRMEATGYDHKDNATGYTFYGTATLPNKDRIPYSRIKGSPFWKDNFQLATLYSGKMKITTIPIRLNLASNEIHFLKEDKEFVLDASNISTIVFYADNNISKTGEIFIMNDPEMLVGNKKVNGFAQVLNSGNHRLLKYIQRKLNSADSLLGTQKKYFFTDQVNYYMWYNEKIERIKKLNNDNILKFLPTSSAYTTLIDRNKIDLKKETDIIRFLTYYNVNQTTKSPLY